MKRLILLSLFSIRLFATDLLCSNGNDNLIDAVSVASVTQGATTIIHVTSTSGFIPGSNITLSGFVTSGYNGTYQVIPNGVARGATITINLNSSALSAPSGGTPLISLTCNNSSDLTAGYTSFNTTYTTQAAAFPIAGKIMRIRLHGLFFSPVAESNTAVYFRLVSGSNVLYSAAASPNFAPNAFGSPFLADLYVKSLSVTSTITPMNVTASNPLFIPGWSAAGAKNTTSDAAIDTTGTVMFSLQTGFTLTGAGGTIAYSSGGTATGTGNCLATATTGSPAAVGLIAVSSGTISGNLSFGHAAQTTSGGNYTSLPTSWTLSLPTTGGASTCSGTITTSGGTLIGTQGTGILIEALETSYDN